MLNDEPRMPVKDMFIYCFLHWRSALALMLVCAVAFGGLGTLRALRAVEEQEAENQAGQAEVAEDDSMDRDDLAKDIVATKELGLESATQYYQDSLLMRMDPNESHVARAVVEIGISKALPSNTLKTLAVAYMDAIRGGESLDALAERMDTTPAYLLELISVNGSDEAAASQGQPNDLSDSYVTTLTLQAKGATESEAADLRDALVEAAEASHDDLAGSVAEHTMRVVETTEYIAVDRGVAANQSEIVESVEKARRTLEEAENAVGVSGQLISGNSGTAKSAPDRLRTALKALTRWGVIGAALAFCAYGFVLCLRFLLGGRPLTRGQVQGLCPLRDLGSFAYGDPGLFRGRTRFDRWLRRLAGMGEVPNPADAVAMAAANVRLYAGEARSVLVTSSVASARSKELTKVLARSLEGFRVMHADGLDNNPAAREALEAAEAVVFVEEYGNSRFAAIDDEVQLVIQVGKEPLGIVMA